MNLGLATPPPSAIKPPRRVPLPSPPLSHSDKESPVPLSGRVTPPTPSHSKLSSLKRKAPTETIKLHTPPVPLSHRAPSTWMGRNGSEKVSQVGAFPTGTASRGKKRRKIKSAAYILDDSPEPESQPQQQQAQAQVKQIPLVPFLPTPASIGSSIVRDTDRRPSVVKSWAATRFTPPPSAARPKASTSVKFAALPTVIEVKQEANDEVAVSALLSEPVIGKRKKRPPGKRRKVEEIVTKVENEEVKVDSNPSLADLSLPTSPTKKRRGGRKAKPITPVYVPDDDLGELSYPSENRAPSQSVTKPNFVKEEIVEERIGIGLDFGTGFDFGTDHTALSLEMANLYGLRRSQRVPKPRIKKEIEEFVDVPHAPRKPRPSRIASGLATASAHPVAQSASSILAETSQIDGPLPEGISSSLIKEKSKRGRLAKVKAEPTDGSLTHEKLFIRIPAAKIRQITENAYEID